MPDRLILTQTAPVTTASFTTAQAVSSALVVPAWHLNQVGSGVRIRAGGVYSDTGTPTLAIGVFNNAAAAGATAALTLGAGVTNLGWFMDVQFVVTALGTSGSWFPYGFVNYATSASAITAEPDPTGTPQTALTVNTQALQSMAVSAAFSASNASNTITVNYFTVEVLSP